MKYKIILIRHRKSLTHPTLGTLFIYGDNKELLIVETLELPWKENKRMISCIPEGVYSIKKRKSKKYGWHFHILNIPGGRTWILIHAANYMRQLRGCIAVGVKHADIDKDGIMDVTSSKATVKKMLDTIQTKDTFKITIQ